MSGGILMRPRERQESGEQDLFRSRLDQVINMDHALVKLARTIDWRFLEEKFGAVYKDGPGQPPLPTRLKTCRDRGQKWASRCGFREATEGAYANLCRTVNECFMSEFLGPFKI